MTSGNVINCNYFNFVIFRPLLKPQDITKFDKLVSPHEAAAMNKKKRNGKEDEEDLLMPISIQPSTLPPTPSTQTNGKL